MPNESFGMPGDRSSPIVGRLGEDQVERAVPSIAEGDHAKGPLMDRNKSVVVVIEARPFDHRFGSPLSNEGRTQGIPACGRVERSLPPLDTTRLLTVITRDTSLIPDEGVRVVDCIQRHYVTTKTPISSFRVRQFVRSGKVWPIAEWKEGRNVEVTAVVMMEDGNFPLSCLMVCGTGLDSRGSTKRYEETKLEWVVGNTDHLRELFVVAQFWLGAAHWQSDKSKTSEEVSANSATKQEYCPGFRLLMRQK